MINLETDFEVIKEWIEGVEQFVVPKEILPSVGAMVEKNGEGICCGFLYLSTDTPVSVIEWVYFNPDAKGIDKYVCADMLYECLSECALAENHPVVFTSTTSDGLGKVIEANGFVNHLKGAKHYFKAVQKEG